MGPTKQRRTEDVSKLKVAELKARLEELGESTKGKKAELVARLEKLLERSGEEDLLDGEGAVEPTPATATPVEVAQSAAKAGVEQRSKAAGTTEKKDPTKPKKAEGAADAAFGANGTTKKLTASQRMNLKKKMRKQKQREARKAQEEEGNKDPGPGTKIKGSVQKEVAYASEGTASAAEVNMSEEEFARILRRFNGEDVEGSDRPSVDRASDSDAAGRAPNSEATEEQGAKQINKKDKDGKRSSKKELKRMNRMKIGELKQQCPRPEVVEAWDVTALDPVLLVHLKAYRNTVAVPRHWSQKRRYLQGKKGIEKPPFQLPAFIAATGIGEMRQAYDDNAEQESLRAQGKARTRPKMNRMDIDYRVLYDAFFKHQEKPPLTKPGELYYEGKEYELSNRDQFKPGILSETLLEALGMERGAPPPWLVSMQRYGPPPSYPSLAIPGLNAPIPPGAQFGYHPGGWGKPPVDEYGNPIYGDVFGQQNWGEEDDGYAGRERAYWGEVDEVESESEEEESEEEESEEGVESEEEELPEPTRLPSSTMEQVQLRKDSVKDSKQLYQVLEQKTTSALKSGVMGSEHVYDLGGGEDQKAKTKEKKVTGAAAKRLEALKKTMPDIMDVAIDPADLESLDDSAIKDLYEAKLAESRKERGLSDLSDMVASHQAGAKRKSEGKASKKEKKFKF